MSTSFEGEWAATAADRLNDDVQFQRIARRFNATVLFGFGIEECLVTLDDGIITEVDQAPPVVGWDFAVRAPTETWEQAFAEVPPPKYNDLRGLWQHTPLTIEGDVILAIQQWRPLKYLIDAFGEATR